MDSSSKIGPLVVIVGQTATGKSALAMDLAQRFNGEIILADSRTLYKGMDIGTAKPSRSDLEKVPHHVIDVTTPDKPITAAQYKDLANKAINEIQARGKLPILVGGSGLYVDSVIFDYDFNSEVQQATREALDQLTLEELQATIIERGLDMPTNSKNKRHLTRRLESGNQAVLNNKLRGNTLVIGLEMESDQLKERIAERQKQMMGSGLEEEVKTLASKYGWDIEPLKTIGYQEFKSYFEGGRDIKTTQLEIIKGTYRYAKRQRTWFKRNKDIHWLEKQGQAVDLVTTFLNK